MQQELCCCRRCAAGCYLLLAEDKLPLQEAEERCRMIGTDRGWAAAASGHCG